MNREIKFRVYDKIANFMHVVGTDSHDSIYIDYQDNTISYYNLQNGEGSGYEDSDYILMQYTGLKDKNGKEIYEGDIVTDEKGFTAEVLCDNLQFFLSKIYPTELDFGELVYKNRLKVIGNIYENKDLLEA